MNVIQQRQNEQKQEEEKKQKQEERGDYIVLSYGNEGEKKPLIRFLPPKQRHMTGSVIMTPLLHQQRRYNYGSNSTQSSSDSSIQHREQKMLMLQDEEHQMERKQRWTLIGCFGLLFAALLCGPMILMSDGHSSSRSRVHGNATKNRISFPLLHLPSLNRSPSLDKGRSGVGGCTPSKRNQATADSVDQSPRHRIGCSSSHHQQQEQAQQAHPKEETSRSSASPSSAALLPASQVPRGKHDTIPSTSSFPRSSNSRNTIHVKSVGSAFPSYLDFSSKKGKETSSAAINVTYDGKSIRLNNEPVVLLGGSMHPTRAASRGQWEHALDEAVHNGLNLITMYVFWSAHQPLADRPLDWSLPYSRVLQQAQIQGEENSWELADAIQSCADRGLFVHLRLGPYTCAEYSYGGIPEWIGVSYPDIRFRRMDPRWLHLMEGYVKNATAYITQHGLWAYQGGPVIVGQIENELGNDNAGFMEEEEQLPEGNGEDGIAAKNEVEEYADWCGDLVQRVAPPQIVWTMCNGFSANNTIETFNGLYGVQWLEHHGDNGRIQKDQPAMWTEDEQGFQVWGETPKHPVDYFWGLPAREVAKNMLRWIARGGLHVNYYMWWGGYNRGRVAAAGILNAYANDALLCPSGERRQPKFGHLTSLHQVIASISPTLVASRPKKQNVKVYNTKNGTWDLGREQFAFSYTLRSQDGGILSEVVFLENNGENTVDVQVPTNIPTSTIQTGDNSVLFRVLTVKPYSAVILMDGIVAFASDAIAPEASAFSRITWTEQQESGSFLLDWKSWREPVVSMPRSAECQNQATSLPVEQTRLLHDDEFRAQRRNIWSDYAWYSRSFTLRDDPMDMPTLVVNTDKATGLVVYLDGEYQGSVDNHEHGEGIVNLKIPLFHNLTVNRKYEITILSESLGYHNLIGRWGGKVGAKSKGLLGSVTLVSWGNKTYPLFSENKSIEEGWCSLAGLQGERMGLYHKDNETAGSVWDRLLASSETMSQSGPLWRTTYFDTPLLGLNQHMFLELTCGRGHVWLNGHDLGRFWNITGSSSEHMNDDEDSDSNYSQRYYHLPLDLMKTDGRLNQLVILNVLAGNGDKQSAPASSDVARLAISWIETSPPQQHHFEDTVGYADSCLL